MLACRESRNVICGKLIELNVILVPEPVIDW
jgi:hypothetical protein